MHWALKHPAHRNILCPDDAYALRPTCLLLPRTVSAHDPPARVRTPHRTPPVDVLGVPVEPWRVQDLIEAMIVSATTGSPSGGARLETVHYANIHVVNTAYRDPALRRQLARTSTVYYDGSSVRLGAAILGRPLPPRLTAADWIDPFCEHAARAGVRLFMVAGADGIAERAAAILRARHPGLAVVGTHHGFLDDEASARVIARANEAGTDLMLVGMGTPTQARVAAQVQRPVPPHGPLVPAEGRARPDVRLPVQEQREPYLQERHAQQHGQDPTRRQVLAPEPAPCPRPEAANAPGWRAVTRHAYATTVTEKTRSATVPNALARAATVAGSMGHSPPVQMSRARR
jgi:exopolysaccharide biosynthesis WecB/TagA/CpsF family protein